MSFKIKYKDKEGDESVEIDFETLEQTVDGMILRGEDKVSGKKYDFIWLLASGSDLQIPPPVVT